MNNQYTSIITKNGIRMDIEAYNAYVKHIQETKDYIATIDGIEDLYDCESAEINLDCASDISDKILETIIRYYKRGSFRVQMLLDEAFPKTKEEAISLAKESRFWRFNNLSFSWGGQDREKGIIQFFNDETEKEEQFFLDDEDIIKLMTLTEEDYAKHYC